MRKIRLLVVEDSILMHKIIADIISHSSELEIVDKAYTGREALEKIPKVKPDIVTLDVHLPDMDGLTVLEEIVKNFPTRVVMLSAYTHKGAEVTMRALELGALDFIPKPSGEISLDLYNFKDEIISKLKVIAEIDITQYLSYFRGQPVVEEILTFKKIVVIAASTGGPKSILEVLKDIPRDICAAFLIVQHMPKGFTHTFAERIGWYSSIRTKEAEDRDLLLRGAGYVAPADFHMIIEKIEAITNQHFRIRLDQTPLKNYVRPSADITMSSVAEVFGKDTIGIVLTGMGKDGLEGCRKIKEKGGFVIAQDEATSIIYGMPKAVAEAGLTDKILGLSQIAEEIIKRVEE